MAGVILEDVCKTYSGNVTAVKDFSLDIVDKEFLVLVGPSGCGKSTTLRMIAGLEEITRGTIKIGERVVNDVPPKARDIAMVFQNYALYPHMTVYDNMAFGLRLRHIPKSEITRRVEDTAAGLGIEELLRRLPKALSGGQRQRVALGRAIVREPSVFLFDEPLSNLDAKMRVEMRTELMHLHKRVATTMIYVTHDQVEAMTLGNRIVVMKDGLIMQAAPPLDVYRYPNNIFVARFIGTPAMNLFEGVLEENGSQFRFSSEHVKIPLPESMNDSIRGCAGKQVYFGIRPEDIELVELVEGESKPSFTATLDVVETLGNEVVVHLLAGKHRFEVRSDPYKHSFVAGKFEVRCELSRGHIFDGETGRNLTVPGWVKDSAGGEELKAEQLEVAV